MPKVFKMYGTLVLILISTGMSVRGSSSCKDCIFIDQKKGDDNSCINRNTTTPCKTIGHVLTNVSLDNREVVLQGDHEIKQTLTVSHVTGLTIRGNNSIITCKAPKAPNDDGSGLVYVNVTDLTVIKVTFKGCGTLQNSTVMRNFTHIKYRSAVYIVNSTNVCFNESHFVQNIGRGVSMYDVSGQIEIIKGNFLDNMLPATDKTQLFGGGGIYIEFTVCSPGFPQCSSEVDEQNETGRYYLILISGCQFKGNKATTNEVTQQSNYLHRNTVGSDGNSADHGGAIDIIHGRSSLFTSITITGCQFVNNSATTYGGSINAFLYRAHYSTISINSCEFRNNRALQGAGGALSMGYNHPLFRLSSYNNLFINNTVFVNNTAVWGGAVLLFSVRSPYDTHNGFLFSNCTWSSNTASIGAAVTLFPSIWDSIFEGITPPVVFEQCTFLYNAVIDSNSSIDSAPQHALESGILHIISFQVEFLDIIFSDNTGSAIFATAAQISILHNTTVCFKNNSAINGGAMALLGLSILQLYPGSQVVFDSNRASELGGALYATYSNQAEFVYSHKCFLSYNNEYISVPESWNTLLIFTNNDAKYGKSIYTDSMIPCVKQVGGTLDNISDFFQWNIFKFIPEIEDNTIATSPATIHFSLPLEIAPGEKIHLQQTFSDDLNQSIPSALKTSVAGEAKTNPYVSDDGYIEIRGKPGTQFILTLQTVNTRQASTSMNGTLGECPLAFQLQNDVCICSAHQYVGVSACDTNLFSGLLQVGYWLGCTNSGTVISGFCPLGYCKYENTTFWHVQLPRSCFMKRKKRFCSDNRRGVFCGQCLEGYTAYYHSDNICGKCSYGAVGLLIYIFAELLPLFILFGCLMVMKLNMASGFIQSFLLFAQTVTLINRATPVVSLSQTGHTFIRLHTFIFGFLNMDFLRLDELSFCLWSGVTVLDNLLFNYLTTLFAIILLGTLIYTMKYGQRNICCRKIVKNLNSFNKPIIHSISTFLILPYTHYTITSFLILSRLSLYGEGGKIFGYVVRVQGYVDYFGKDHLPYAIPAVLVLIFLSIPPPLLLISYPLLWKIKAKFRRNTSSDNDTTVWPIGKLLPLIDSFQGVFKDTHRMFAGLYLVWRLIIAAVFAFSANIDMFFLFISIALFSIFIIHSIARPYQQWLYNVVDVLMLANMLIINILSWFLVHATFFNASKSLVNSTVGIKLFLMYLPLFLLIVILILKQFQKCKILPNLLHHFNKATGEETQTDEDIFSRAAEINNPPLALTGKSADFELKSIQE